MSCMSRVVTAGPAHHLPALCRVRLLSGHSRPATRPALRATAQAYSAWRKTWRATMPPSPVACPRWTSGSPRPADRSQATCTTVLVAGRWPSTVLAVRRCRIHWRRVALAGQYMPGWRIASAPRPPLNTWGLHSMSTVPSSPRRRPCPAILKNAGNGAAHARWRG